MSFQETRDLDNSDKITKKTDSYKLFHLQDIVDEISNRCLKCPKCSFECSFLEKNGCPGEIAKNYNPKDPSWLMTAFDCSLCGLCSAVCPVNLSPENLFLEMRRCAVSLSLAPLLEHKGIISYEKRGTSKKYSWYSLPEGCDTILFPGCTFAGTRSDTTIALYKHLKESIPDIGIVLDCCCKPSHDLGRYEFFNDMFFEMSNWLSDNGVRKIIVACPNCYKVFKNYSCNTQIISAYEILDAEQKISINADLSNTNKGVVSIHDPCVLRNESSIHDAVRNIVQEHSLTIKEMSHNKKTSMCCGEGGSVGFVTPRLSKGWRNKRVSEANNHLLTYCAGCAGLLNKKTPTDHILDLLFFPEDVASGKRKATKPPFTYINRLRLKRYLKKEHPARVTRERNFFSTKGDLHGKKGLKTGRLKLLVLFLIIALIAGLHFSGITKNFDSQMLRQRVEAIGPLAPLAFILLYSLAPALFLPGLPITIAGGVLFGPFFGVVYSITGATIGASISFLVSRYIARNWIESKLDTPKWQNFFESVEKNGWKIIAFTRLVPLFPFNLLNYAFGLTPIKFLPYAITSFICMLPACIAFIVFSSSFIDLLKGNISSEFLMGIILIAIVSAIPMILKKFRKNNATSR